VPPHYRNVQKKNSKWFDKGSTAKRSNTSNNSALLLNFFVLNGEDLMLFNKKK
jgi:hypothetical protein